MFGLLILKIVCWAYLIFMIMGRIANYDKWKTKEDLISKVIDNATIALLILLILVVSVVAFII